ncbi:MAG: PVC-type heme-binding CxxCH protein, partial [Phycisphaeraceae bacterium]
KVDSVTTFAEGLNIPSGIAVGHGGVWVANAPDILFLQDTTGDGKADKSEVIVTGFDRNDTHELPNSFTWGPDGWLYGLHGVFNYSRIHQGDETFDFSAAIFRIHPVTHEFQLFAEGTSNPWGLAFDAEGNMFISACVIDHLWHITESGYYVRQAGTYPPFTWRIGSIVDHRHQMAAYAGLVYLDSDAYPEPYRDALFMGNIHGAAINHDVLQRRGSTYQATPREDFLQANDPWFMPVSQSVGPDGLLYVLDWYDRYHCYQDARRDPEGVNRTHGRIWRLRHSASPSPDGPFPDMGELSDDQLINHLASRNVYHRETAQRLLAERLISGDADARTRRKLQDLALADDTDHKASGPLVTLPTIWIPPSTSVSSA